MTPALTGLVLAGGAGTRMGRDKATVELDGERLIDRAVRRLLPCCTQVLVAPGPRRDIAVPGARSIPDVPGEGPLAGIVAGLQAAATPLLAVVGADMPDISPDVLTAMAGVWDGEAGVVARVGGMLQPLHALYATAAAPAYAQLLAGGERSARRALESLGARVVDEDVWRTIDPQGAFARSLNSPEELAAYRRRSPRPPPG